jgi:hypothetical protein
MGATRRRGEKLENVEDVEKVEGTAAAAFFIERSPCNFEEAQSLKAE